MMNSYSGREESSVHAKARPSIPLGQTSMTGSTAHRDQGCCSTEELQFTHPVNGQRIVVTSAAPF